MKTMKPHPTDPALPAHLARRSFLQKLAATALLATCLPWGVGTSLWAADPLAPGTVVVWGPEAANSQPPPDLINVVAIAAGIRHCAALKADGTVTMWGEGNGFGRYDVGANDVEALMPPGLANVVAIAAGKNHMLALKSDGTVVAWGRNNDGECNVPAGLANVVAISGGFGYSIALKADGTIIDWGSGANTLPADQNNSITKIAAFSNGFLGQKSDGTVFKSTPMDFAVLGNFGPVQKLTAQFGSAVLSTDGTVAFATWNSLDTNLFSLKGVISIDLGDNHILALTSAGNVVVYGFGTGAVAIPAGLTNNVVAISSYERSSMALVGNPIITQAPQIVQAPANQTNQAGSTAVFTVSASGTPPLSYQWRKAGLPLAAQTLATLTLSNVTVSAGGAYDVVVSGAGSVTSAPPATLSVLGPPVITSAGALAGIAGVPLTYQITADGVATGYLASGLPTGLSLNPATGLISGAPAYGGTYQVSLLATNLYGTGSKLLSLTMKRRGSVVAWGANTYGATDVPAGLTTAIAIAGGAFRSVALLSDGTVTEWGDSGTPFAPLGLTDVESISAGFLHVLAVKKDGTVAAWGSASFGETTPPASATNVVRVAAGDQHSLALKRDGTVVAWGRNDFNQTNIPPGLTNVVAIAAKSYRNLALLADGTVIQWGSTNGNGLPSGLTNVVAISLGAGRSLALKADGTVVSWGDAIQTVPQNVTNVQAIAAGGSHNLVLRKPGSVPSLVAWGGNFVGQLDIPMFLNGDTNVSFGGVTEIAAGSSHSLALVGELEPPAIPVILQSPQSKVGHLGGAADFLVTATGTAPLSYQWFKESVPLAGATNAVLTFTDLQLAQAGAYAVVVANAFGAVTSSIANLTVNVAGGGGSVLITVPPINQTVSVTSNATFTVTATGTAPLVYQWRKDGVAIGGANGATLSLVNVQTNQAGGYSVVIANGGGSITSSVVTLTVNRFSQTIAFGVLAGKQVGNIPFNLTATANSGLPVSFSSSVTSVATVSGSTVTIIGVGSTTITASQGGDATYLPASSVPQTLVVSAAPSIPSISTPPLGQSFTLGSAVALSVSAGGTGPLFYQWQFNGVNIAGATTATLALSNLSATNAGAYRVVITNAVGSITSLPVDVYFYGDLKFIAATVLAGSLGQQYRVDYADVVTVGTTNWQVLTNLALPYSPFLVIDPASAGKPKRFYRAVPLP